MRSAPAPAKVNLTLEVTGHRADGYHSLVSIIQTLALADEVSVSLEPDDGSGVVVGGSFAENTPSDRDNLAWKAAEALARLTGHSCDGLRIEIEKNIPPAGGLGGGASDAATVLRLLQTHWGATEEQLTEAANLVGSDEAALVLGGRVLATGRGDCVRPLQQGPSQGVVLFLPDIHIDGKRDASFKR